jgi:hypothetical protein
LKSSSLVRSSLAKPGPETRMPVLMSEKHPRP